LRRILFPHLSRWGILRGIVLC